VNLRNDPSFVVAQDLAGCPRAFGRAALHETLEVLRGVLAGEVTFSSQRVRLPGLLVAAELRVLADLPLSGR
jgi:hypothetical protein